ncbi:MAG: cardiolipin synthase [Ruminococcus sp.]
MRFKRAWFRALVRRRVAVILLLVLQVLFICYVINSETTAAEIIRVLLRAASGFIALHVVCQKDKGAHKVAWISLTLLFPLFGSVLYLLCYFQSSTRHFRTAIAQIKQDTKMLYHRPGSVSAQKSQADLFPYSTQKQYIQDYAGFPAYDQSDVQYYSPGEMFWAPFLYELRKAQSYIFMEYFILDPGLLWDSVLEILIEKASCGVDVRIIYDDIGCFLTLPSNFAKQMAQYGIKCVAFNPFRPFLSTSQNNRDHRKITAIDGTVAFTGGLNLADEYVNLYEKHGYWKDCAVKVEGKAAWSLTLMFLEMWELCCKTHECFADFYPADGYPQRKDTSGYVQPYADSPLDDENVCEHVYMQILNQAKEYVYITTPYLIVDGSMVSALCLAAKSGVDVRIITPQVWDKALIHMTTRSYYRELTQGGVKIYEYTGGFIHSKTFVSDDRVASVGTANLDFRSLYLHFECGIWMCDKHAVMKMKQDFLDTVDVSHEITFEDCKANPIKRAFQSVLRLFAPLM